MYVYMHNHALFILHILTYYVSLESYSFWRYGSSVGVVGVSNLLFV